MVLFGAGGLFAPVASEDVLHVTGRSLEEHMRTAGIY
jgi:hypothetical protein